MLKCLVTGGNGFVGKFIVDELLKNGFQVRVLDLLDAPNRKKSVEYLLGNFTEPEVCKQALEGINHVYHCAAVVPLLKNRKLFQSVNAEGVELIYNLSVQSKVDHFCQISSSAIYGLIDPTDLPITEESIAIPCDFYGLSKKLSDDFLMKAMQKNRKMTCSIIRPRTVVGAGRLGIFHFLFNWIEKGSNIYLLGSGKNMIQLIHPADLARAAVLSAMKRKSGSFNVGASEFGSMQDLIQNLSRYAKTNSKIVRIPVKPAQLALALLDRLGWSPFAPWHYMTSHIDYYFDISKAKRELGWAPEYSNNKMLEEAYREFVDFRDPEENRSIHLKHLKWGALSIFKSRK